MSKLSSNQRLDDATKVPGQAAIAESDEAASDPNEDYTPSVASGAQIEILDDIQDHVDSPEKDEEEKSEVRRILQKEAHLPLVMWIFPWAATQHQSRYGQCANSSGCLADLLSILGPN